MVPFYSTISLFDYGTLIRLGIEAVRKSTHFRESFFGGIIYRKTRESLGKRLEFRGKYRDLYDRSVMRT
jgi:hypothetical protein